ncbi:phosphatase PAP2 family protein [Larkinella insperata]|uniref:Phosphatase PAP2 family protein n=1 Tax=Larkinella insperata TaxID=332158 RepID=A0ABW3QA07_9BACT|nr:phosphatase PAP2 family protein [Larkinella insperata]
MKVYLPLLVFLFYSLASFGQVDTLSRSPYRVYKTYELPASLAVLGTSIFGFRQLDRYASFTTEDITKLNPVHLNAFDRPIAYADPAGFDRAQKRSDQFLNLSIASPLLLMLSKDLRKEALDLLTIYTTAHAVNNLIYFATTFSIRRARPLTYNPAVPLQDKIGYAKSNSFYSGHVSFSTTATFFGAKVLTDYYHLKGWKRAAIFTAAALPPILVGVNRMQAGKHFRTDVLTGFVVGAACGIGVPELHKLRQRTRNLSFRPEWLGTGARGFAVTYTF